MSELLLSFTDCTPDPQEQQITVLSDLSDQSDGSDYTVVAAAARDFSGWIVVTAKWFRRAAVQSFRRIICKNRTIFNRRAFVLLGGLRL